MTPTLTPDPAVALAMMRAGYWITPLHAHKKNPPKFGGRTHGEILADKDKSFLDALVLQQQHTGTGWAAILQATDPLPLVVVDVDAYGISLDAAWAMLSADAPPPGLGVVKSATGGWHFYMRLPDAAYAKALGGTWDFGNGRKGEIRASRDVLQLIVLPGSVARNKHGDLGRYESAGHPLTELDSLAVIPETLLARLANKGRASDAPAKGGLPTEAHHLLGLIHFISEISPGEQNSRLAQIGQVFGRLCPAEKPTPDLTSAAWDVLRDKMPSANLSEPWSFSSFEKTFQSGYRTGRKNGKEHAPADKFPSETDVLAEVESALGWLPRLVEVSNARGEFQEYLLGTADGGSVVSVKDKGFRDILAELARLVPSLDNDAFVRSPLFLLPTWQNVLRHFLMRTRTFERVGNDPETLFWEIINEWARGAAQDGKFIKTVSGPWRKLDSLVWICAPPDPVDWALCLHPDKASDLSRRIGNYAAWKRLMRDAATPASLAGTKAKMFTIGAARLTETTRAHLTQGYNSWINQSDKQLPNDGDDHESAAN